MESHNSDSLKIQTLSSGPHMRVGLDLSNSIAAKQRVNALDTLFKKYVPATSPEGEKIFLNVRSVKKQMHIPLSEIYRKAKLQEKKNLLLTDFQTQLQDDLQLAKTLATNEYVTTQHDLFPIARQIRKKEKEIAASSATRKKGTAVHPFIHGKHRIDVAKIKPNTLGLMGGTIGSGRAKKAKQGVEVSYDNKGSRISNTKRAFIKAENKPSLQKEITLLKKLKNHDGIIQLYETFVEKGTNTCYLVEELCEGSDLFDALYRGTLSETDKADIALQLFNIVADLNEKDKIIHSDLKPANIFIINKDGKKLVKLLDFNAAYERNSPPRRTGGTNTYMHPEHLAAYQTGKKRTDEQIAKNEQFSLGLNIFDLLADIFSTERSWVDPKQPTKEIDTTEMKKQMRSYFKQQQKETDQSHKTYKSPKIDAQSKLYGLLLELVHSKPDQNNLTQARKAVIEAIQYWKQCEDARD